MYMSGVQSLSLEALSKSDKKRSEQIKKLGAQKTKDKLEFYIKVALTDSSSVVRREAVSAIGRLKDANAINTLIKLLEDEDPKIVAQSMRALFHFVNYSNVLEHIHNLIHHENEMIKETALRFIAKLNKEVKAVDKKVLHTVSDDRLKNLSINGLTENVIKSIPDESVHLTFTSPPYYNARDYTFYKSYEGYLDFLENIFTEVHRITKEGRYFILNTSPIIVPRVSRQHASKRYPIPYDIHARLVKNGWEFIDDIVWVKPEASVKNRIGGFFQHRKPLAYKPNAITESIMVYRKKSEKLLDWNIRSYSNDIVESSKVKGPIDTSNVWFIDPVYDKKHSAVFPKKLCEKIIKYYSYKGDLVFDPFAGSGTFGLVAQENERNFLMIEADKTYFEVIKERINSTSNAIFYSSKEPDYITESEFIKAMK